MAETTTIRVPLEPRARIHALAQQSGRWAHRVILKAVERHAGAVAAAGAIRSAIDNLRALPLLGRRVHGGMRELAISYGTTGYIELYRCLIPQDEIRILAIGHQREIGFVP